MISYYRNLFKVTKELIKKNDRPDLIIASSPHPLAMVAGIRIAKKLGVPCICEVRDFWPEVFFMGGRLNENSIIGKLLIKGEHWIYKNSDALIFLKEGDYTYITDKKWDVSQGGMIDLDRCYYINNGVNIDDFNHQIRNEILEDEDLTKDKFNVVYAGAIRPVNNVGNILDAAKLLKENKNIQFLIYGDGNQLESLRNRVINQDITNVKMKGYVDKKYMPYVLSKSSINILNYSQSKYNWSRGNSSNKLFEYMASGKPIISTVKMGYSPIEKYDCGVSLEEDTPEALAEAVLRIYNMAPDRFNEISENANNGAKDFDYKELTKKLISVMESQL
jgi:glycosyltransferase involved in cell wall biosynthesis